MITSSKCRPRNSAGRLRVTIHPTKSAQTVFATEPVGEARRFLTALFGSKPAALFILIWRLATKRSAWFRDPRAAADYVEAHRHENVYVGVAASKADFGPTRRCKSEETAAIFGVYA